MTSDATVDMTNGVT